MYTTPEYVSDFKTVINDGKLHVEEFSRNPDNRNEILDAFKLVGFKPLSLNDLQKKVGEIRSDKGKDTPEDHCFNVLKDWNDTCVRLRFGFFHHYKTRDCDIRNKYHRVCSRVENDMYIFSIDKSILRQQRRYSQPRLRKRTRVSYQESSDDSDAYAPYIADTTRRRRYCRNRKYIIYNDLDIDDIDSDSDIYANMLFSTPDQSFPDESLRTDDDETLSTGDSETESTQTSETSDISTCTTEICCIEKETQTSPNTQTSLCDKIIERMEKDIAEQETRLASLKHDLLHFKLNVEMQEAFAER